MEKQVLDLYPPRLHEHVHSVIGPFHVTANFRPAGARTGVWRLQAAKASYYVKTFSRRERWVPEVYAYRHWMPQLKPYVPELAAVFEEEGWQAILITALDGTIMRDTVLTPGEEQAAYRKAGELTRTLHRLKPGRWFGQISEDSQPPSEPEQDAVQYISRSIREMKTKCEEQQLLSPREMELAEWALQNVEGFAGARPVPVSWDSTPGNWLVDANGRLCGMIDFENMLWGIDVDQFSILFERYFMDNPATRDAFFDGYGPEVLTGKAGQIKICCIKLAIADIYWGTQNGWDRVRNYGRRLLKRIAEDDGLV
ncbi:aminoglycoside phosphotransferase family protein [Paenibacillus sp. CN-4]|uniref:aminoglycoside phosphotransferase family protein n=1 Tax=Paenibacillus nanchangensis TaxID=3348343 RepID=UPI00397CE270